jgi:toxin HigB-1
VIQSFADAATRDVFDGSDSKAARRIPKAIWPVVRRKLDLVNRATSLQDLAAAPGNRLEALKGDQRGRHRIRVNDRYRITFRFVDGQVHHVRCEDYHP